MLHRLFPLILLAAAPALAAPPEGEIDSLLERAREVEITLPAPSGAGQRAAEEAYRLFSSPGYQRQLEAEGRRIGTEVFGKGSSPAPAGDPGAETGRGSLGVDERIYVFVSSSVPLPTLRNYAADLARVSDRNVAMVLRGFVGGARRMGPTAELVESILKEEPECDPRSGSPCAQRSVPVLVDPLLFRRYGIGRVPAVVYARGVSVLDPGESEERPENARAGDHFTVYGDAALGYALELIQREAGSPALAAHLQGPLGRTRPFPPPDGSGRDEPGSKGYP